MARSPDPRRLDVDALTADGGRVQGQWPAQDLRRWAAVQTPPSDTPLDPVDWSAQGEREKAWPEPIRRLALEVDARAWLTCQRCLQPMQWPVRVRNRLRFVAGEAAAEALDAEVEEDVLALQPALDLRELVEDELLLALPIVPRHEVCPQTLPLVAEAASDPSTPERPNPFAALAKLKKTDSGA